MTVDVFEFYLEDSLKCRKVLAEIYIAFEGYRSTVDPLERGIQFKTIKDSLASVGYQ